MKFFAPKPAPPGNRAAWSGQLAFILAAAASAVGLGNIWRFPYLAAKYGGGIFLVVYMALVVTLGFALMVSEVALGRLTGLSAIEAFRKLDRRFAFVGWVCTLIPALILPYYCVIGGWVTKYLCEYAASMAGGGGRILEEGFFPGFISHAHQPLFFGGVFVLLVFFIVVLGVKKGIETSNRVMMPLLLVFMVLVSGYVLLQPGAAEGLKYYLLPDFSRFSHKTVLGAMGQMFYSLSLAMGIMITYGSYLGKDEDIVKSVRRIEAFDTGVAFLAGLMIIPAVVLFAGGDPDAVQKGPGLMFDALPKVFAGMGMASLVGTVFFLLVLFAALTSAVSLMETVVASIQDKLHTSRLASCVVTLVFTALMAVPSALGYGTWRHWKIGGLQMLDFFDFVCNSVLMPVAACLTCLFIGWVTGCGVIIDEAGGSAFKGRRFYVVMTKYIAPLLLLAILVSSILDALGIARI